MKSGTILKTFLYSFSAILAVFLGVEVLLRILNVPKPPEPQGIELTTSRGEKITLKNGRIRMGLSPYMAYKIQPSQKTSNFSIDANGFRGPTVDLSVRKEKRIFILGGSATFGLGAATDEATFVAQLANRHPEWQVVNAGVTSFSSGQELSYLMHYIIDYTPDVVVTFDGWNDFFLPWYNFTSRDGEVRATGFGEIEAQLIDNYQTQSDLWKSFSRLSRTFCIKSRMISLFAGWIISIKNPQKARIAHIPSEQDPQLFENYLSNYIRNIRKMAMLCHSQGIRFILVLQPDLGLRAPRTETEENFLLHTNHYEGYLDQFSPLYRQFLDRVKASPELAMVEKIDTTQSPRWLNTKDTLFLDWVHLSPSGNIAVADILDASL